MPYLAVVPTFHIDDVWMRSLSHIVNGREHWDKFYTLPEIKKNLLDGRQQLWVMIDGNEIIGVVLTQIDQYPQKKSLRIFFLGGKGFKKSMMKEIKKVEKWAAEHECSLFDFLGRDEWMPLLKKFGFSSVGRVYRKEL